MKTPDLKSIEHTYGTELFLISRYAGNNAYQNYSIKLDNIDFPTYIYKNKYNTLTVNNELQFINYWQNDIEQDNHLCDYLQESDKFFVTGYHELIYRDLET